MGDFNVDVHPWIHPHIDKTSYQSSMEPVLNQLIKMCTRIGSELIKTEHTRIQGKSHASTLDLVLSNRTDLISNVTLSSSSSDHKVVSIKYTSKPITTNPAVVFARSYKNYTKQKVLQSLRIPDINRLLWSNDTEEVANVLTGIINEALDEVAPFTKHKSESTMLRLFLPQQNSS